MPFSRIVNADICCRSVLTRNFSERFKTILSSFPVLR